MVKFPNKKNKEETKSEEERKEILFARAQEDLNDLERYIEEFTTFLPLAVCALNPLNIILSVNKAFCDLTGYEEIEVIGERIEKLFKKEKTLGSLFRGKLDKESAGFSQKMILFTKDDREIPVNMSLSPRKDEEGNFLGYFISLSDITEFEKLRTNLEEEVKKRTKDLEKRTEELRESRVALMNVLEDVEKARKQTEEEKNKTMAIITNFSDGLLLFDFQKRLSLINSQAKKYFGIESDEIIGKGISDLAKKSVLKPVIEIIKEDKGSKIKKIYREELKLKENLFFEISTIPLKEGKENIGNLVILHDVSREKVVEKLKTEFVSLAAHQLRTPLSAIKWTLRMLLDGDLGKVNPDQKEYIEKTYKSNERMITLINDLLNVTRIEEGRYLYKQNLTEVQPLVEFIISSLKEKADKENVKIKFKKPKQKLPKIKVDIEKVRMAIYNIVNNAVSYTLSGGKVDVVLLKEKGNMKIEVKDSGIGIPEDQQKRVFSKFFRADNAVRENTTGTGLGLYITKNIIEAHDGKIWFESESGKGTTFYITIPFAKNN
jgi:PAS domain S-box-containing protein